MSAILAIVGPTPASRVGEHAPKRMLAGLGAHGASRTGVWHGEGCTLAVARYPWELHADLSGDVLVATDGDCVAVADASLYYRDDLARSLSHAGVRPVRDDASHLILAAYRAWGDACAERLEGDFAFVVYDGRRRRVFGARDFVGSRPLFAAELPDGTKVIASSIAAIMEHPACDGSLDPLALALDAAGLAFSVGAMTCRKHIQRVGAATTVTASVGGALGGERFWTPRAVKSRLPFEEAGERLLELLGDATLERLGGTEPTAMWLSGGWDSTAIFAAGHARGTARGRRVTLHPVSLSHPADDCGHEDDKIAATAERWGTTVSWVSARELPMLDTLLDDAGRRDEPIDHLFGALNGELASRSRAAGARIAFDGYGGDFLFNSSSVFLADLVSELRFGRLAREWASMRGRGFSLRHLLRYAVQPHLGSGALELIARLRGGRYPGSPYQRSVPFWIDRDFAARNALMDRARVAGTLSNDAPTHADRELAWFVTQPFYARSRAMNQGVASRGGVELRAPLMDRRLLDFALSRPATERTSMGQGKRLLRHAMHGLLPESVLAPRPYKTGNLNGYFKASFVAREAAVRAMVQRPLLLEQLGIIDGRRYRNAVDFFFRQQCEVPFRLEVTQTLLCEQWLRSAVDGARAAGPMMEQHVRHVAYA